MKTRLHIFVLLFILLSSSSYAQKSVFESAGLTKLSNGSPCIQLNWKKGVENTAYYIIERSIDGIEFKQVALVFTSEDNDFTSYKFRDTDFEGRGNALYYRIAIVSDQKELTYLPLKKVEFQSFNSTSAVLNV